jgi:hypothetical protein
MANHFLGGWKENKRSVATKEKSQNIETERKVGFYGVSNKF